MPSSYLIEISSANPKVSNEKLAEFYKQLKQCEGDVGLDLPCIKRQTITSQVTKMSLGVKVRCFVKKTSSKGKIIHKRVPYMLVPRSSITKYGISMVNSPGIIDTKYEGTLGAGMVIVGVGVLDTKVEIKVSENKSFARLFQVVTPDMGEIVEVLVNGDIIKLDKTLQRDEGGFGSTDPESDNEEDDNKFNDVEGEQDEDEEGNVRTIMGNIHIVKESESDDVEDIDLDTLDGFDDIDDEDLEALDEDEEKPLLDDDEDAEMLEMLMQEEEEKKVKKEKKPRKSKKQTDEVKNE